MVDRYVGCWGRGLAVVLIGWWLIYSLDRWEALEWDHIFSKLPFHLEYYQRLLITIQYKLICCLLLENRRQTSKPSSFYKRKAKIQVMNNLASAKNRCNTNSPLRVVKLCYTKKDNRTNKIAINFSLQQLNGV